MSKAEKKKVVIVGAGISGLACAYKLKESAEFKAGLIDLSIIEASGRAGGIIDTTDYRGCALESGPDSFITNKPYMVDLVKRLGLSGNIISTESKNRGAMVVSKGRLVRLPEGFNLMAPSRILPFLESPIMSIAGKLRVLAEPFSPVASGRNDESVAAFVRRRFGREMLDKLVQPMVGGIYVGDVEKLSASMALERFVAMEQKEGSVLSVLMREAAKQEESTTGGDKAERGVRYGLFCSFDKGMKVLVDKLLEALAGVEIKYNTSVSGISFASGSPLPWTLKLANSEYDGAAAESIGADYVVLALPANISARLLADCAPGLAEDLGSIPAASSAVVNMMVERSDIAADIDAFGVVVPAVEARRLGLHVIAVAFASHKFKGRAPEGKVLLRAFVGGAVRERILEEDDEGLAFLVMKDLRKLLEYSPTARPEYTKVWRWPGGMPQFQVGHRDLICKIEAGLSRLPGLFLAGASLRGVGLPECVASGEVCAEKISGAFTESHLVV